MKRWLNAGLLVLTCGCGGAAQTADNATTSPSSSTTTTNPGDGNRTPATTRIHAVNFGGLVRGAQALSDGTPHAELGCLLGLDDDHAALGASPVPALSALPDAPMHLAESLPTTGAGHARVLTRWGQRGGEPFDLLVATFTPLPPQAARDPMVVATITRAGIVMRETDAVIAQAPLNRDDAAVWLLDRSARGPFTLIVTAEAETAAKDVHALLKALPSSLRNVALAVALSSDTRLPSTAPQAPDARVHCPDGLPEPASGAAEGDLPSASIVRSLSVIHEPLQRCLANTNGPGAVGGKVTLALRIADTGNVSETCLVEDAIHDNVLAACLTETARTATFSRPHPIGFVDVHIPLSLAPVSDPAPRAICE